MRVAPEESTQASAETSARQDTFLCSSWQEGKRQYDYAREALTEMCDAFKHKCILSSVTWRSCYCTGVSLTWERGGSGCGVTCHTKYTRLPQQRVTGQQETAGLGKAFRGLVNREPFFAYVSSPRFSWRFQNVLSGHQHSLLFLRKRLLWKEKKLRLASWGFLEASETSREPGHREGRVQNEYEFMDRHTNTHHSDSPERLSQSHSWYFLINIYSSLYCP